MSTEEIALNSRKHPAGIALRKIFKCICCLCTKATKNNLKVSRNNVRNWLRSQETYTLHKLVCRNYPRNRVFGVGIDDQIEAD